LAIPTKPILDQAHAGQVFFTNIDSLQGNMSISDLKSFLQFSSDSAFSRLGYVTQFNDFNGDGIDDLFVSQPYKETLEWTAGRFFIFLGGKDFPIGDVFDLVSTSSACFESNSLFGLTGSHVEFMNFFSNFSGLPSITNHFNRDILVGSPASSFYGYTQAGFVALLISPIS